MKQFRVNYVVFFKDYLACQGRYNESVIFDAEDEMDANVQFTEYTQRALRERARDRLQVGSQITRVCISRITPVLKEKNTVRLPPRPAVLDPMSEEQEFDDECMTIRERSMWA